MTESIARPWRGGIPLSPRTALGDLIARVFSPPFSKILRPAFDAGAAAAIPWYLSGGIAAAICSAAYDAKNAASQAASYDNLASAATTYDLTLGTAPAWAAGTGWTFTAASSQYLKTGWVPNSGVSAFVQYSGGATQPEALLGGYTNDANNLRLFSSLAAGVAYCNGSGVIVAPTLSGGNLGIAGLQGYRNGVANGATVVDYTTGNLYDCYIGAYHNALNPPSYYFTGVIKAVAFYSVTITQPQITALVAAMATL